MISSIKIVEHLLTVEIDVPDTITCVAQLFTVVVFKPQGKIGIAFTELFCEVSR